MMQFYQSTGSHFGGFSRAAVEHLASAASPFGLDALATAAGLSAGSALPAAAVDVQPAKALVAAIVDKAAPIPQGESEEEPPGKARQVIERQISILEEERNRLVPIASREHWIALIFAVLSGSVFLGTIALVVFASGQQALITLVSSVLPGFLSTVFFARETKVESRIANITSDLRQSERTRDRVAMFEGLLPIIPVESRAKFANSAAEILT